MAESTCVVEGCEADGRLRRGMCSAHYQAWRKANLEEAKLPQADKCSTLGCDALTQSRYGLCAWCYRRRWESENSERRRAYRAARAEVVRGRSNERARGYREANPERFRDANRRYAAKNPEARKASQRKYRKTPRGQVKNRQKGARRRARMREAFVETVDYAGVLIEHGMFCHICSLVIVDHTDLHFDHVIPLAAGGLHEAANIRPAHAICNLRKGPRVA